MLEFKLSDLIIAKIVPTMSQLTYWQTELIYAITKKGLPGGRLFSTGSVTESSARGWCQS